MKVESIRIENFRCFKDQTITFEDYTCFVGPNGAGKSTVFSALNIFFRQYKDSKTDLSKLSVDDFNHRNTSKPIKITVTFTNLSEEAKKTLSDYVRQDKLVVSSLAEYDLSTETAEVKQFGNRLGFEEFRTFFEEDKRGAKTIELKETYATLRERYTDLPKVNTKSDMIEELRKYESKNIDNCKLILSEDQFYGITKGVNKLSPYIQWVFIAAVKDITEESEESKKSALGQLLSRTVRSKINFKDKVKTLKDKIKKEYQEILNDEQKVLKDISESLQEKLKYWSHPNINAQVLWKQDSEKSIKVEEPWAFIKLKERGFEGDLSRFGLGLQRSYMLALLQEVTNLKNETEPTLIMGIEEPELYQHPPQARYLAEILQELSESNTQIVICSHNPLFIPGDNFETIRLVRERGNPSSSDVSQLSYFDLSNYLKKGECEKDNLKEKGVIAKLYSSLNPIINEMFFCNILILVEGIEDVAYITTYLMLTDKIKDFRRCGCHIVSVGGKSSIIKPLAVANLLKIPVYVVCDGDTDKNNESEIIKHKKDNKSILYLSGHKDINEWPSDTIFKDNLVMWKTNLTEVMKVEIGENWQKYKDEACNYYGNAKGLKKNSLAIAYALELAWKNDNKANSLITLVNGIIAFAENNLE